MCWLVVILVCVLVVTGVDLLVGLGWCCSCILVGGCSWCYVLIVLDIAFLVIVGARFGLFGYTYSSVCIVC